MRAFINSTFLLAISYMFHVVSLFDWLLHCKFLRLIPVMVSGTVFSDDNFSLSMNKTCILHLKCMKLKLGRKQNCRF